MISCHASPVAHLGTGKQAAVTHRRLYCTGRMGTMKGPPGGEMLHGFLPSKVEFSNKKWETTSRLAEEMERMHRGLIKHHDSELAVLS
jgi:hypothetical protein